MPEAPQQQTWTFETLAEADRRTLEKVLLEGTAPDPEQLNGWVYCGWNHEPVAKLSGEKLRKGFRRKDGLDMGYNELVRQDKQGYHGKWEVKTKDGRPRQLGYFRLSRVQDEPPQKLYAPYRHLGLLNYDLPMNGGVNRPFRVIRDFLALVNPGDHTLMLGKAYLHLGRPSLTVFYSYFLLGHRQQVEHEPW